MIQAITGEGNIVPVKRGISKAENIRESRGLYALNLLKSYNRNKAEAENLKLAIEEISVENDGMNAIVYDSIKTSPTYKINRVTEDLAIDNIKKKAWYKNRLRKKEIEIRKVDNALEVVTPIQKEIIRKYYIEGKSIIEISMECNISEGYCSTLKNSGVKKMAETIF